MSILTKKEIVERINNNQIAFSPSLDAYQIQPNSIDLRVGWTFYIPETWKYNEEGRVAVRPNYLEYQKTEEYFKMIRLKPVQFFEILPNEFVIISTLENISLNCGDLNATLHPRSSIIRRGLQIQTGVVDCRYQGQLMIPVFNTSNQVMKIFPGERFCQLQFCLLASDLDPEAAKKHGVNEGKYIKSTPYSLEAKTDPHDEIDLIKAGKLEELKDKFKL